MEPNSQPLVNANPIPGSSTPPPTKKNTFLYVLSGIIFVFSIGYATFTLIQNPQTTSTSADEVALTPDYNIPKATAVEWTQLLNNIPKNPTEVVATASAQGETVTLQSGEPADYDEVTFTWSGDKAVEPGTEITGYLVYFGPKNTEIPFPEKGYKDSVNPKKEGVFVDANTYTAKNLERGKTYYLYVQSFSNSKNKNPYYHFGMEHLGNFRTLAAKKLFTYIHK